MSNSEFYKEGLTFTWPSEETLDALTDEVIDYYKEEFNSPAYILE